MRLPSTSLLKPTRAAWGAIVGVLAVIVLLLFWEHFFGLWNSVPGPLLFVVLSLGTLLGGLRAGVYSLGLTTVYFACFHLDLGSFDPSRQNQQDLFRFVAMSGVAAVIVGSIGGLRVRLRAVSREVAVMQVGRNRRKILEKVLAASHDAVVELTTEGVVWGWNAAAAQITGYTAQEAIGQHIFILAPTPEMQADQAAQLARACRGEPPEPYDACRVGKGGHPLELRVCSVPVLGEDGQVESVTCLLQDQTARRHSELALRHSEERFHQVAQNLPGALWMADLEWKFLYVSAGYEAVFQRPVRDFIANQQSFLEFIYPEDVPKVLADYTSRPPGVAFEEEYRVVLPDGTVNWVRNRAFPVRAADGSVTCMTGLATDITESKRVEAALRASESRFRTVVEQASDPMMVHDPAGRFVDVNHAACRALGYTREELLGLGVQDVHPDYDWSQLPPFWTELPPGEVCTLTGMHCRKDGSRFPVETHVSVVSPPGTPRRLLATVRDMTAQRRASEQLAARARQQQAIATLGLRALRQDPSEENAFGALCESTSAALAETLQTDFSAVMENLPGTDCFVFRGVHGWPNILPGQEVSLRVGNTSLAGYTLLTKTPVIVADYATETRFTVPPLLREAGVVSGLSVLIYGEDETILGILSVHHRARRDFKEDDVAFLQAAANILGAAAVRQRSRARLQLALQEAAAARQEAERANRAKSEFLSRTSHELRTPLNAILGFGQLLQMDPAASAESQDCTNQVVSAGRHLLSLIDDVLDIARIESGNDNLRLEPVEVGKLVQSAVDLMQLHAREEKVRLNVHAPPVPCTVQADPRRLKQVLLNLLSNGIKYNQAEGAVTVDWLPEPNGTLRLRVRDTGRGLTPPEIERLCSPFERLGAEQRGVQGTGLGLALSRRLVEAMGGRFGISSTPGAGSVFWIDLPSGEPMISARPDAAAATRETMSTPTEPPALQPQTILQIEDNLSNQRVVQILLAGQRPQWQLLSAADARTGLETARCQRPAVILLDLQLPDQPGDEVLTALRADPLTREIPVVMLSADATPYSRERLLANGALAYMTKPFNVLELLRLLDATLGAPSPGRVGLDPDKQARRKTTVTIPTRTRRIRAAIDKQI